MELWQKVIPVALNAVSTLFPHYSLHDESHSITIINNIVRVLDKEKLGKLSAIDIWLILEASYCHDIGMVVSRQTYWSIEIKRIYWLLQGNTTGQKEWFAWIRITIQNSGRKNINYNSTELNLEYHDGIKFILAEFLEEYTLIGLRKWLPTKRWAKLIFTKRSNSTKTF